MQITINSIAYLDGYDIGQPVWIESQNSLFWVNHSEQKLYQYEEGNNKIHCFELSEPILNLSPSLRNGFIATLEDGIGFYDMKKRKVSYISKPEPFSQNKKAIAGITDQQGNYWSFTLVSDEKIYSNFFYQISPNLRLQRFNGEHWHCSSPPAFSKDSSKLYQSSRTTRYVYVTTLNQQRQPIHTEPFCRINKPDGYPHGLCVDNNDCVWVCHRNAGLMSRYSPDGECLERVEIDAESVSFCTFGGANLGTLYIFTLSQRIKRGRNKGKSYYELFSCQPEVSGSPIKAFAG